jgi:hypothetical protein
MEADARALPVQLKSKQKSTPTSEQNSYAKVLAELELEQEAYAKLKNKEYELNKFVTYEPKNPTVNAAAASNASENSESEDEISREFSNPSEASETVVESTKLNIKKNRLLNLIWSDNDMQKDTNRKNRIMQFIENTLWGIKLEKVGISYDVLKYLRSSLHYYENEDRLYKEILERETIIQNFAIKKYMLSQPDLQDSNDKEISMVDFVREKYEENEAYMRVKKITLYMSIFDDERFPKDRAFPNIKMDPLGYPRHAADPLGYPRHATDPLGYPRHATDKEIDPKAKPEYMIGIPNLDGELEYMHKIPNPGKYPNHIHLVREFINGKSPKFIFVITIKSSNNTKVHMTFEDRKMPYINISLPGYKEKDIHSIRIDLKHNFNKIRDLQFYVQSTEFKNVFEYMKFCELTYKHYFSVSPNIAKKISDFTKLCNVNAWYTRDEIEKSDDVHKTRVLYNKFECHNNIHDTYYNILKYVINNNNVVLGICKILNNSLRKELRSREELLNFMTSAENKKMIKKDTKLIFEICSKAYNDPTCKNKNIYDLYNIILMFMLDEKNDVESIRKILNIWLETKLIQTKKREKGKIINRTIEEIKNDVLKYLNNTENQMNIKKNKRFVLAEMCELINKTKCINSVYNNIYDNVYRYVISKFDDREFVNDLCMILNISMHELKQYMEKDEIKLNNKLLFEVCELIYTKYEVNIFNNNPELCFLEKLIYSNQATRKYNNPDKNRKEEIMTYSSLMYISNLSFDNRLCTSYSIPAHFTDELKEAYSNYMQYYYLIMPTNVAQTKKKLKHRYIKEYSVYRKYIKKLKPMEAENQTKKEKSYYELKKMNYYNKLIRHRDKYAELLDGELINQEQKYKFSKKEKPYQNPKFIEILGLITSKFFVKSSLENIDSAEHKDEEFKESIFNRFDVINCIITQQIEASAYENLLRAKSELLYETFVDNVSSIIMDSNGLGLPKYNNFLKSEQSHLMELLSILERFGNINKLELDVTLLGEYIKSVSTVLQTINDQEYIFASLLGGSTQMSNTLCIVNSGHYEQITSCAMNFSLDQFKKYMDIARHIMRVKQNAFIQSLLVKLIYEHDQIMKSLKEKNTSPEAVKIVEEVVVDEEALKNIEKMKKQEVAKQEAIKREEADKAIRNFVLDDAKLAEIINKYNNNKLSVSNKKDNEIVKKNKTVHENWDSLPSDAKEKITRIAIKEIIATSKKNNERRNKKAQKNVPLELLEESKQSLNEEELQICEYELSRQELEINKQRNQLFSLKILTEQLIINDPSAINSTKQKKLKELEEKQHKEKLEKREFIKNLQVEDKHRYEQQIGKLLKILKKELSVYEYKNTTELREEYEHLMQTYNDVSTKEYVDQLKPEDKGGHLVYLVKLQKQIENIYYISVLRFLGREIKIINNNRKNAIIKKYEQEIQKYIDDIKKNIKYPIELFEHLLNFIKTKINRNNPNKELWNNEKNKIMKYYIFKKKVNYIINFYNCSFETAFNVIIQLDNQVNIMMKNVGLNNTELINTESMGLIKDELLLNESTMFLLKNKFELIEQLRTNTQDTIANLSYEIYELRALQSNERARDILVNFKNILDNLLPKPSKQPKHPDEINIEQKILGIRKILAKGFLIKNSNYENLTEQQKTMSLINNKIIEHKNWDPKTIMELVDELLKDLKITMKLENKKPAEENEFKEHELVVPTSAEAENEDEKNDVGISSIAGKSKEYKVRTRIFEKLPFDPPPARILKHSDIIQDIIAHQYAVNEIWNSSCKKINEDLGKILNNPTPLLDNEIRNLIKEIINNYDLIVDVSKDEHNIHLYELLKDAIMSCKTPGTYGNASKHLNTIIKAVNTRNKSLFAEETEHTLNIRKIKYPNSFFKYPTTNYGAALIESDEEKANDFTTIELSDFEFDEQDDLTRFIFEQRSKQNNDEMSLDQLVGLS